MSTIRTIEGGLTIEAGRFVILVTRFNGFICESLLAGALDGLKRHGVKDENIRIVRVPGRMNCRWWRKKSPHAVIVMRLSRWAR